MTKPSFLMATNKVEKPEKQESTVSEKRNKFEEEQRRIELDLIYSETESKEVFSWRKGGRK